MHAKWRIVRESGLFKVPGFASGSEWKMFLWNVVHRMNEVYRARRAQKNVLSRLNRGLGIKIKKCLYTEVIIVPTALYGAESWGMRGAEK